MNVTVIPAGADLYIARYKLFGIGGVEQDIESAIAGLTKKAESMSGGNRTETKTARMMPGRIILYRIMLRNTV